MATRVLAFQNFDTLPDLISALREMHESAQTHSIDPATVIVDAGVHRARLVETTLSDRSTVVSLELD